MKHLDDHQASFNGLGIKPKLDWGETNLSHEEGEEEELMLETDFTPE